MFSVMKISLAASKRDRRETERELRRRRRGALSLFSRELERAFFASAALGRTDKSFTTSPSGHIWPLWSPQVHLVNLAIMVTPSPSGDIYFHGQAWSPQVHLAMYGHGQVMVMYGHPKSIW